VEQFNFIEQKTLYNQNNERDENKISQLKKLNLDFSGNEVRFLGLDPSNFNVSYYIGIDWLKEKECYITVEPKIKNLDYVKMFVQCLQHQEISKHFSKIYNIDFKKPQIKTSTINWDLTPFLIVHFLSLVEKIVNQGLRSNYIVREENLNSKIKGKIIFSQQIKKNIVSKRKDHIYCRFQEYNVNCQENRLLKKALLYIQRYSKFYRGKYPELIQKQNKLLSAFENISDEISFSEIKHIKINRLFKEYIEAIELAKQILRIFGYSYKNTEESKQNELPPFWIDMSKLFELYVYCLLKKEYNNEIFYQSCGNYGEVDFFKKDEKLIIDTKYKLKYSNKSEYVIEDIRQLSGYARDKGILKKLKITTDDKVVDCVIIYPCEDISKKNFAGRNIKEEEIEQFTKFYKCGVWLPRKE